MNQKKPLQIPYPQTGLWKGPIPFHWLILAILIVLTLAISGCQSAAPTTAPATEPTDVPVSEVVTAPTAVPTKEPVTPPTTAPAAAPSIDMTAFQALWEKSPHGNTYDLGKGPNTYCSRCHSPQNWDPASSVDKAPNCVTCKFATDPKLREATTMAFVEEKDWKGIGCDTCHVTKDGQTTTEIAWLNPIKKAYEPVATVNQLCTKCHATTQGVSASGGRGVDHGIVLGGSAHLNWAGALPQVDRPDQCTDCHDPHSTQPKQCTDCHGDVLTSDKHMNGTNGQHKNVSCMACHDASGSQVGPDEAQNGLWVTILVAADRSGKETKTTVVSHSIKWQVACDRCHFKDNPNGLTVLDATGKPPKQ